MSTDTFDDAEIRDAFAELVAGARPPGDVLAQVERRIVVRRRRRRTTTGLAVAVTGALAVGIVASVTSRGGSAPVASAPVAVTSTLAATTADDVVPVRDLRLSCLRDGSDDRWLVLSSPGDDPFLLMRLLVDDPITTVTTFDMPMNVTDGQNPIEVRARAGSAGGASWHRGSTGDVVVHGASCEDGRPSLDASFAARLAGSRPDRGIRLDGSVHTG